MVPISRVYGGWVAREVRVVVREGRVGKRGSQGGGVREGKVGWCLDGSCADLAGFVEALMACSSGVWRASGAF